MNIQVPSKEHLNTVFFSPQGGTITGWYFDHHPILFPQQIVDIGGKCKLRGGSHWCFPWFGPRRDGQHGFLRDRLMQVETETSHTVEFVYRPTVIDSGYERWRFRIKVTISIDEWALGHKLFVQRDHECKNPKKMPVALAAHPYILLDERTTVRHGYDGEVLSAPTEFRWIADPKHHLTIHKEGVGDFRIAWRGDFFALAKPHLGVWSDSPNYVCGEGISGHPDEFATENGVYLAAGEYLYGRWDYNVIDLA